MAKTVYAVTCGRGVIEVTLDDAVIKLRGEKQAVLEAAWCKLLGENDLGEVVNKRAPSRRFLIAEIKSRHPYLDDPAKDIFWNRAEFRVKAASY